jgi:hypothetical protein
MELASMLKKGTSKYPRVHDSRKMKGEYAWWPNPHSSIQMNLETLSRSNYSSCWKFSNTSGNKYITNANITYLIRISCAHHVNIATRGIGSCINAQEGAI